MATHSRILAWTIPLSYWEATHRHTHTHIHGQRSLPGYRPRVYVCQIHKPEYTKLTDEGVTEAATRPHTCGLMNCSRWDLGVRSTRTR